MLDIIFIRKCYHSSRDGKREKQGVKHKSRQLAFQDKLYSLRFQDSAPSDSWCASVRGPPSYDTASRGLGADPRLWDQWMARFASSFCLRLFFPVSFSWLRNCLLPDNTTDSPSEEMLLLLWERKGWPQQENSRMQQNKTSTHIRDTYKQK